jgi:thymidylate synthase ThyX
VGQFEIVRLLLAHRIGDATIDDHRYYLERSARRRRARAPPTAAIAAAPCAERADAGSSQDKRDPTELHAHILKRNRTLRNGHRYALAAARFTLPQAFATGFGMSAISSPSSHT